MPSGKEQAIRRPVKHSKLTSAQALPSAVLRPIDMCPRMFHGHGKLAHISRKMFPKFLRPESRLGFEVPRKADLRNAVLASTDDLEVARTIRHRIDD
ncbi:UNVERIFIED_ORG: hypothetical protein BDU10_9805 [Burkholderia sp. CF145]